MSLTVLLSCSQFSQSATSAAEIKEIEKQFHFHKDGYMYWNTEECTRKHLFAKKVCQTVTTKLTSEDFERLDEMGFIAVSTSHWKVWIK